MSLLLFKSEYVDFLKRRLKENDVDPRYYANGIIPGSKNVIENPRLDSPESVSLKLIMPEEKENFEFENSKILYAHFKKMNITQATDARIWTHLTHVTFWEYTQKRRPVKAQPESKQARYILRHYFVDPVNAKNLLLNDIALLWWAAHLSYDEDNQSDPFWLTAEVFTQLDFTRHLLPGSQGRSKAFALAVLQFVAENRDLFKEYKQGKIRLIMRKCNFISGYKLMPTLSKSEILAMIEGYRKEIAAVKKDEKEADSEGSD